MVDDARRTGATVGIILLRFTICRNCEGVHAGSYVMELHLSQMLRKRKRLSTSLALGVAALTDEKRINLDEAEQGVNTDGTPYLYLPYHEHEGSKEALVPTLAIPAVMVAPKRGRRLQAISILDIPALMERPFFAVGGKPVDALPPYVSPGNGRLSLAVRTTDRRFGVATLRDAEVLMYLITSLNQRRSAGLPLTKRINTNAQALLAGIARSTGGRQRVHLNDSLERLRCTEMMTNIGPTGKATSLGRLHLVEGWSFDRSEGLAVDVNDWIVAAIEAQSLLTLDPGFLNLPAGYSRWLYRVARKHAGHNPDGWTGQLEMLWRKSGSSGPLAQFKLKLRAIVEKNELPGYDLAWIAPREQRRQPEIRMRAR